MIKTLSELGVLPEKRKYHPFQGPCSETLSSENTNGYNEALSECAGRKIEVKWDREKLAEILRERPPLVMGKIQDLHLAIADAIIASEEQIIKVVKYESI